ncbi:MAG: Na+-transporting NADH:ubiquinone oxidoreductase subunit A [Sphingobacteriales bacterium]|jgi:Na+-transporting NADH:ubiquinone oxidoreductase subunit A
MSKVVKLRKGFDIKLQGEAEKVFAKYEQPTTYAIKPADFNGILPKLLVEVDDKVKVGSPLFYHKDNEKMLFTSPVSGVVKAINRGDKRIVEGIVIEADKEMSYESFKTDGFIDFSREQVIEVLLKSGLWGFIKERPFDKIANPEITPKSIFVSAFDTSPLAADFDFIVHGNKEVFQAGLDVLGKLTTGAVNLNVNGREKPSEVFTNAKNVIVNSVQGPHPAGNVGIQIHHIDPINKGQYVWTLNPQAVISIGRLFTTGKFNSEIIVALTGSEVKHRKYHKTNIGACIDKMVKGNLKSEHVRYISGNVLTGSKISENGYLGFNDSQVTVIPEGDFPEFFGWLKPGFDRPSNSRALLSSLPIGKSFEANTNEHGELRAFVVTGEYEKVLPMDIYPVHLLKAILYEDIEEIEGLGIYEVAVEDLALCEFVCSSKFPVTQTLKKGLELIERECF